MNSRGTSACPSPEKVPSAFILCLNSGQKASPSLPLVAGQAELFREPSAVFTRDEATSGQRSPLATHSAVRSDDPDPVVTRRAPPGTPGRRRAGWGVPSVSLSSCRPATCLREDRCRCRESGDSERSSSRSVLSSQDRPSFSLDCLHVCVCVLSLPIWSTVVLDSGHPIQNDFVLM